MKRRRMTVIFPPLTISLRTLRTLRLELMDAITQTREITAARRLDNVRYAIRDLACVADEVIQQGHKVLAAQRRRPTQLRFPDSAAHHRSGLQSHARRQERLRRVSGIPEALEAIRGEAARKSITTVRDVFITSGVSETVDLCISALVNPVKTFHAQARLPALLGSSVQAGHCAKRLRFKRRRTPGSPNSPTSNAS